MDRDCGGASWLVCLNKIIREGLATKVTLALNLRRKGVSHAHTQRWMFLLVGTGPGPRGYFFHGGQEEQAAKCVLLKGQLEQGTDSFVSVTPQAGRGRVDSGPEYAITETPLH